MYKQCWVNCTFHTQLKHAHTWLKHLHTWLKHGSHGMAGSCFLKVRAASLIRPRKVTQVLLKYLVAIHVYAEIARNKSTEKIPGSSSPSKKSIFMIPTVVELIELFLYFSLQKCGSFIQELPCHILPHEDMLTCKNSMLSCCL